MIIQPSHGHALDQVIQHLQAGELVAIPTETVYGLAADASNVTAIQKIFSLKRRPLENPLIVHLADVQQLAQWTSFVPNFAWQLAEAFWPGPLTLILPKAQRVNGLLTANQETIGLRVPAHPVAQAILQAFGGGLAAPSANPFMALSPTTASHVAHFFNEDLWIVDGGASAIGLESTIIDCSRESPVILRAGAITSAMIKEKTNLSIVFASSTIKHPGQHKIHYAPKTPLYLLSSDDLACRLQTNNFTKAVALLIYNTYSHLNNLSKIICLSNHPDNYAREFYRALHELDDASCEEIWLEIPPSGEAWQAVHERLAKASSKFHPDDEKL